MAKQLKDILAGTRSSKIVPGNLGKDPGVDYEPKAGDEQKFAALHVHQKHEYPHGNETLFTGAVDYSLDSPKEKRHGNTEKKAEKAAFPTVKESVEPKKAEDAQCNRTPKGTACPLHGMNECMSVKTIKEQDIDEAMSPKQKQHSNRVKTMPGKKGHVMGAASNFEAPFHKVHATVSKNGGAKEVVKHELQAKDKHDAIFNVQMMHHKAGHKIHDVKHKGLVKEEAIHENDGDWHNSKDHKPLSHWPKVHAAVHRSFSQAGGGGTDAEKKELGKTPIHPDHHAAHDDAESDSKKMRKAVNRHYSHDVSRGLNEEVEQIDELSTDLLHRAAHKAAKIAMTDVQGRSGPIFKKRAAQANKFRAKGMEQEKKERAMKEEALDELSPATMKSYVKKAGADKRDSEMRSKVYSKLANTLDSQNPKDASDVRAQGHGHYVNAKKRGEGIKLAKKKLGEEALDEVLTKSTTAGETISDFVHSKNPKFAGKSKEKRKEMALAAYYQKQRNEEVEILEDAHEIAKKYKDYVTGGGTPETASRYKSHVNMLSKKTGEHPDVINKQVKKHVKAMKEDVHGSSDIAKYKTNDTEEEIEMVRTELKAIANKTMHMLSNMPANHHIEPWIQAKIAAAKEMIGSVHDYMMYSEPEEDEQTDTPVTFPNMANDSAAGVNV